MTPLTFPGAAGPLASPWVQRASGTVNRDGSGRAIAGGADTACFVTHETLASSLAQSVEITLYMAGAASGDHSVSAILRGDAAGPLDAVYASYTGTASNVILFLRSAGSNAGEQHAWDVNPALFVNGAKLKITCDDHPTAPTFTLYIDGVQIGDPWTWNVAAAAPQGFSRGFAVYSFSGPGAYGVSAVEMDAAAAAPSLEIQTQPAGAVVGEAFTQQPVVRFLDAAGVLDTAATAQVTATLISGTGAIIGTAAVTPSGGLGTYTDLGIGSAVGAHTVRFSAPGYGSIDAAAVTVVAGAAAKLGIVRQPAGAVNGAAFGTQPQVEVQDANGFRVTTSTATITAAVKSGGGTILGTAARDAASGLATWVNLGITGTGAHVLEYTSPGLTSVDSAAFTVAADSTPVATALEVVTQPAGAVDGAAFTTQPVVRVIDQFGAPIAHSVTITATKLSGGATLSGTAARPTSGSQAAWTDLALAGATGAHVLRFSAPGLGSVDSASFNVAAAGVYPDTDYVYFFPKNADGDPIPGKTVLPTSSASGVALVQSPAEEYASGQYRAEVSAIAAGSASISSTCDGKAVQAPTVVTVHPAA